MVNEPKPEWRDGVPWCARACPEFRNKGFGCVCAVTDAPLMNLAPCAPAIRRLVGAARPAMGLLEAVAALSHGEDCTEYDCECFKLPANKHVIALKAALPPEDGR